MSHMEQQNQLLTEIRDELRKLNRPSGLLKADLTQQRGEFKRPACVFEVEPGTSAELLEKEFKDAWANFQESLPRLLLGVKLARPRPDPVYNPNIRRIPDYDTTEPSPPRKPGFDWQAFIIGITAGVAVCTGLYALLFD